MTRGSRTRCTYRSPGIGSREARSTRRSRSSELRFPHAFPKTCGNSTGDLLDLADTCGILVYRLGRHVAHRGAGPRRDCLLLKSFDLHVGWGTSSIAAGISGSGLRSTPPRL